jgi:nucleotide-binding universal stress UspA family protein
VAHAWHLQEEQALRNGRHTAAFADEVDRLLDRERDNAQARLQALLADYPQVAADDVHLIKGNPGAVIADHATAMAADLIVMGTVGRTGLSGLIMGNTAETILGQVRCSVIAVKPDGFVSPITLDQTG